MKKILLSCMMFLGIGASAQTTLISPTVNNGGFESGATNWTVVNGSQTNKWRIDTGANAGFSGVNSAYVSNGATSPYTHNYSITSTSTVFFYQDVTFPAGETDINLSFNLLVQGEGTSTIYDYLRVYLVPTTFTPTSGTVPSTTTYPNNWTYNLKGAAWGNQVIPISASQAGNATASSTMRLIFMWRNDDTTGTQPPAAVDDITLVTQAPTTPPVCTTISAPANGATAVSRTPTITWAAATGGVVSYKLNIGTTPGGTDVMNGVDVGNVTSYTIPTASALLYSTTYYVTVLPTNGIGSASGCTESSFTTAAIGCPSVTAPTNNAVNASTTPTITWSSVAGATGYRLSVGTTSGGTDVINNIDLGNFLTYTLPSSLNYSTDYFYTVNAYQGTNSTSASCTVRKFTTRAAPPANDDCANAVALTVNPDMSCAVKGTGNTLGATQSMTAGSCTGTPDDDVWFSFVATNTTHSITLSNVVSTGTSSTTDMYFQVLNGTCGSFTSLLCSDDDANAVSGLTPGQTYYVRVYTYSSGVQYGASFDICVGTLPPAPSNDDCAGATPLTVSAGSLCTNSVAGTTLSASNSGVAVSPCTGVADDDVWYSFVATSTSHIVALTDVVSVGLLSSTSLYLQVLSGTCGSLTSVICDTTPATPTVLTGLTVGGTYYVRVYNSNTGAGYANTFKICVTTPVAPANDDCAAAVALTVNSDLNCGVTTAGTTHSATNSSVAVSPCTGTADDDVWYTFTAVGTSHVITLSNVVSTGTTSSTSLYTQVLSGACGTLTNVKCGTTNTTSVTGLTPGQTYYVRVYNSNGAGYSNSFNICIGTPPPPPTNDACSTATNIASLPYTFNQNDGAYATNNGGFISTCSTTNGMNDGMWYTFTGDGSSTTVKITTTTAWDPELAVYTGSCGSFTCVGSVDATAGTLGNIETLTFNTTLGTLYYVNVGHYNGTTDNPEGNFKIDVTSTASTLGTSDVSVKKDNIKAYPNPFADVLNISDIADVKSVSVIDISGRVLKTIENPSAALHLGDLKSGMYLVVLNMKDGSRQTIKAIKK